ncbi:ABC transporter substrate-binding protein [Streptomyces johnsoniae]|uniref:Extracellular solute-binding protein n=1 Tax=Streptomyces johnsoniae TaxID=3075532 RepID=A0ABU2S6U7_9ACTN|nr:extracellular solute-binding protein [Streptomyces sp. DSM 41886]MDT0444391.1 extracellular solute-binding protein [Streptomyces sp. DSM 41886]
MSGSRYPLPLPTLARRTVLAAAVGAVATACGTAAGQPAGKVALHGDNASWEEPLAAAGRSMESVAGLELVPEVIPSLESFEQIVKSSLRTNKTPDMLKYSSGYRLRDLARTGGIEDLTRAWQNAERRGWVDGSLREAFTHRERVYGLPMNMSYWVFFYNTEVFAEHGLSAPRTWDAFLDTCARLKRAGIVPLHATTDGRWPAFIWFMEVLSRQDPEFYEGLMNGREDYTDPRAERALATIADFFDRDWFTALDMSHVDAAASVVHGTLGMMPGGTFMTPNFTSAGGEPGGDIGAFVLPMADPGARPAMIFESSALVCTVKGPDRDEALRAADAWLHPEVSAAFSGTLQDGSPNPRVGAANPLIEGIVDTVRGDRLWLLNRFWELGPPELVEATVDDLAGLLLNPSSYRSVLRTMQGRAEEAWQVWREAEQS